MTDANEMCESVILDQDELVDSDTDDTKEEHGDLSYEESASGDIPTSLLSYFESSKSRAAVCEKFILEDPEDITDITDITASYRTEGLTPIELNKEMMKVNEQAAYVTENVDSKTDDCLLYAHGEMQTLFTHNVSLCPDNEDEAETDEHIENQNYLTSKIGAFDAEEMQKKEQRRQREIDFQEELRKLMEAEKLHQMELELMEKRAQEKLEQELLLQQELISNLQKRVDKEKRMIEEELKKKREEEEARRGKEKEERRKREEEEKRKRKEKEEKRKNEEEDRRKRQEERKRIEEEEQRKIEKMRLKEEDRRKKEEEEMKKKEEEEKRKREEEENKLEEEMKKENEERKRKEIQMREEEERRNEEMIQKEKEERKGKDEKQFTEVAWKKTMEDEKNEEEVKLKGDLRKKEEEERNKKEEEEVRITKEVDVVMHQEEMGKKVQERKSEKERGTSQTENKMMLDQMRRKEEGGEEKRMDKEKRHGMENKCMTGKEEEKKTNVIELEKKKEEERKYRDKEELRVTKEPEVRMKQEQMGKNGVEGRGQEDSRKSEVGNKMMHEQVRKKEEGGEERMDEEKRHGMENKYMTGKEEEEEEEEHTEELEGEIKRQKEEEECRNREEETRLKLEMQENEASNRETEHERDRKDQQERQEERGGLGKKEDGRQNREGVRENIETEERRLKESDISTHNTEKNGNTVSTGHAVKPALTSSSPAPLHNESTDGPGNSKTLQQHDQAVSQTIMYKTMHPPAALPCSTSCSSAARLSDRTEQKRLSWMKDCIPWSKLSLQNRRKQKASVRSRRGVRKAAEASSLPPLCTHTLLQSTGCRSLQEVTTVTLEDLPGCSLSTLTQCPQLRSLTLRRCGLRSLEGISQLRELCYIDLRENEISFMECENMTSLRVLRLAHNKLSSIHGLTGVDNLDVLDLSHNSITRIAGLESVRRLQRLSLDHNQLISTKGLRDVYTLIHLDCSHNHLARVEGLENSALLHTLDLRANSLSEPPSLNNQVLLRELHLDDNSISSLQDLSACWLPLMQHLSAAQNRITQLPSMSDFVSLENLDLRFNCLSEVQNVCDNLEGCQFLQDVQLTGNPLQQEHGWRATLQKALPGLRAIDSQQTDSFLSPPAVQQVALASGCFLTFCQAQIQQTRDLQQHHSMELSDASSSLDDAMRHFTMTLKLAEEQRFAHEYGDTTVCEVHWAAVQTKAETLEVDTIIADYSKRESNTKMPPVILSRNNLRCRWGSEETAIAESRRDTFDGVKMGPEPAVSKPNSGGVHFFATKGKTTSFNLEKEPVSNQQDLHLKNTAAVVIQQHWRKYRQKFGNIHAPPIAEKGGERGGDGGKPDWGPSFINRSVIGPDYAATVIQAYWRGFSLRRRLASALAAVTWCDAGQDDTFEEVDMDEFIFDEAALEKDWTFSENSPPRYYPVSQQPLSPKPPGPCLHPSQYILPPPLVWSPKQAWVAGENVDSAAQRISPESSSRSKSPASTSVLSGLSERSEKILEEWGFTDSHTALMMLKRAQKMKAKKEQKKHRDPSIHLALFRNKKLHQGPVEARNRPARHMRNYVKVGEAGLGLQQGEQTEQVKREQAQQWLHTQAAQSDRLSESEHFLPEINASILNGGRVQLVADPAYADRLHHATGSLACCSLAAQSCKVNSYPRRNSSGHTRKEVPSPKRVTSAPSKKERISFRDNPVQLSGGWGGGKKRDRVYK